MSDQKFADTHNLVAFLEKPVESEGFEEIVDFLNANPIKYALTVNPTVYCLCIKQFWDTVKVKTVNGEVQLQALVDKKKVIITESIIRRDLQLEDAEGTECLHATTIFEELTRMGYEKLTQKLTFYKAFFSPQWKFLIHTILQYLSAKTTAWNEFSSTMASAIICLATNQKFNFSKYIFDSMVKNVDSMVKFLMYPSGPTEHMADETENVESVPTHSNDPLLDSLKLNELIKLCTNLQKKVLDLETTNTIQALEIDSLKRRVKKLEKKQRLRTHKLRRLYKVGLSAKVISSDDEASLGDQEDASKQGRKILDIYADEDITLDSTHVDIDPDMFRVHDLHGDEVFVEIKELVVNVATTTTTTAEQPSQVKGQGSKDKGKEKMIEPKKPLKKKDQVLFDEQESIRLQAQFDEEAKEVNVVLVAQWNDIQDKVETYYELVQRLQQEEQEELTIEEKSKLCKRVGDELEQEKAKKQKIDDDQEEAKLKGLMEVIFDEEGIAIDVIPLSTKPPSIVDYKIIKEGKISIYQIIRADGSSKRYSAVIHMLKNFDKEDLETLWKIVKARHGYTRPEEGYERVLWGDLKTMFEHHVEDLVWRYIQGNKVTVWKLFDSCGVHFVRFSNMHLFMLVEKRYPLTKATIIEMLNKKLQADHWNEMCYQLLKLMTKQLKIQ
ncbi:hypothetical protein Tco_0324669 [Tanacetum coccineum]